jgi:chemotaxis protein methyltransferase CheR
MYFDNRSKMAVLEKIADILAPDGYLLLGPVETAQGLSSAYETVGGAPGVYARARPLLSFAASG